MDKQVPNLLKYVVLVILAIVGGYYLFLYFTKPTVDVRKFMGNIVNIEDEVVNLHGVFVGLPETAPKGLLSERDFSFRIDGSTSFKKFETILPSWKELRATGATSGSYNLKDLPRTEGVGSLDDLRNSLSKGYISVQVDFPASIYGSRNPIASFVFYHILVTPPISPQIKNE